MIAIYFCVLPKSRQEPESRGHGLVVLTVLLPWHVLSTCVYPEKQHCQVWKHHSELYSQTIINQDEGGLWEKLERVGGGNWGWCVKCKRIVCFLFFFFSLFKKKCHPDLPAVQSCGRFFFHCFLLLIYIYVCVNVSK